MRRMILMVLPYSILCLLTLLMSIIWWPIDGGWVQLTNSWVALFFISSFCAIFLFQEEIYHFFDQHVKKIFFAPGGPLQRHRDLPEIIKDDQKFQEMISGTVMAWMEKVNFEKEEKKLQENGISQSLEQYKKTKKENIKWLFLFADCFLVKQSKDILYEIYERHYLTEEIFNEIAEDIIRDEKESEAILEILRHLKFIKRQENEIIITEIGSAYCSYLEQTIYKK